MNFMDEYQNKALTFRKEGSPNEERVMGLLAECGEVAGVFQKMLRGDYTPEEAEDLLKKELGDVLWYLSQVAFDNGWKLSDIAVSNMDKLESRRLRNLIQGNGDMR